jgi:predicted 3-demethylubiquinone-9 3-methyltransferase (glyoxalase superfamily)
MFAFLFVGVHDCYPQDSTASQDSASSSSEKKPDGFQWLKQFEGNWTAKSKTVDGQDAGSSKLTSHVMGSWVINQQVGIGSRFRCVQTLSFDESKNEFKATWIDSMLSHQWDCVGTLDESGKLTLTTKGPDWSDMTKTRNYRDIYEFTTADEISMTGQMQDDDGKWNTFMLSTISRDKATVDGETNQAEVEQAKANQPAGKVSPITPFLMFTGKAEEAISFYKTIFKNAKVESIVKYGAEGPGKKGTVQLAYFVLEGQRVMCIDSPAVHNFDFTPSFSFFVECESEEQLKERFEKLSEGGKVMMPVNNYGFSKQFGWASDKFGVSWQLNLK